MMPSGKSKEKMSNMKDRKEWAINLACSLRESAEELTDRLAKRANELADRLDAASDHMTAEQERELEASFRVLKQDCAEDAREASRYE